MAPSTGIYDDVISGISEVSLGLAEFLNVVKQLRSLARAGLDGYEYVLAERTRARLKEISADSSWVLHDRQSALLQTVDQYIQAVRGIQSSHHTQDNKLRNIETFWAEIRSSIAQRVHGIDLLLEDLANEQSDFVLEKAYQKLIATHASRKALLNRLFELPPPTTDAELQEIERLSEEYKRLLKLFEDSIDELNEFLKRP